MIVPAQPSARGNGIVLHGNKVITVTKKTVRFSRNVYQTCNITGLSEGEIEMGTIPWVIIVGFFVAYLAINAYDNIYDYNNTFDSSGGIAFIIVAIVGVFWNLKKPKHYGLLLTLNSGDKKLFVTTDKDGISKVVEEITYFMEVEKSSDSYQISINRSHVQGNLVQGSVRGGVRYQ
ncbi:MAG: DUF6232 family protein [Cyanobacteriota bacterium]|nr:DUF6232 family protein [Cyanobacteriota bacterium]